MSDHPPEPPGHVPSGTGRLAIRVPPDDRFRPVLETAVRIYLRPICGRAEGAPEIARELLQMVAEVAAREPIDVVLDCRLPELEITVASGRRRVTRAFRF